VRVYIVISMNRVRIAHKLQNDLTVLLIQETYNLVWRVIWWWSLWINWLH